MTDRGQREGGIHSEEVARFDLKSEKLIPNNRKDLLLQELQEVKEREKIKEINHKEAVAALNERIQQQQKEMTAKDQKCMMMEEELRRQEVLALGRKTQIEELKRRVNDMDILSRSQVNGEQDKT